MARLRPVQILPDSPLVGEVCALCQAPFEAGERIVICPEDGVRHHAACWQANEYHCVAFGCSGHGRLSWHAQTIVPDEANSTIEITPEDPLLDPDNIPQRPLSRPSAWKNLSRSFRGCLIAGSLAICLLCMILLALVTSLLLETSLIEMPF